MLPSLFLMEVTVSCSGAKLHLEPNRKLQPNHSQNLSVSRRFLKLCGAFSRERWKSHQCIWTLYRVYPPRRCSVQIASRNHWSWSGVLTKAGSTAEQSTGHACLILSAVPEITTTDSFECHVAMQFKQGIQLADSSEKTIQFLV